MRKLHFAIFFSTVFIIYLAANYYVFVRAWLALSYFPEWQQVFVWVFPLLALAYPVGRFLETRRYSVISNILHWIGAFWLGILLYSFLFTLLADLLNLLMGIPQLTPDIMAVDPERTRFIIFILIVFIVIVLNVSGHLRAIKPGYRNIKIPINKSNPEARNIRLALISDVHLGTIIGTRRLSKIVDRINKMEPDGIIIAGDLVDEDITPVIKYNMGRYLSKLKAPVFAVTGNHEYIGGVERSLNYLKQFDIRYLRDEWLEWKGLVLAGREDKDKGRFTGKPREKLEELFQGVDRRKGVVLIDHQPLEMKEKQQAKVDLNISGHTHNGQNWPLNYIASASYRVANGYALLGDMHVFVSSGVGGWGPPVRIGTKPEIVQMDLEFYGD